MEKKRCPECKSFLGIKAVDSKVVFCDNCRRIISIEEYDLKVIQKLQPLILHNTRLSIDRTFYYKDKTCSIVGVIKFTQEKGFWYEWHLLSMDNERFYFIEDESYYLFCEYKKIINDGFSIPGDIYSGQTFDLYGEEVIFRCSGWGMPSGIKGCLMDNVLIDRYDFIRGISGKKEINIVFNDKKTIVYKGDLLQYNEISIK